MYRVIEQELNFTPQIQDTESKHTPHTEYTCDETGHKLKTSPGPVEETKCMHKLALAAYLVSAGEQTRRAAHPTL